MVHLVRKKIGNNTYLYLQQSFYIKSKKKRRTRHVAYLGKESKLTKKQIQEAIKFYSKQLKGGRQNENK